MRKLITLLAVASLVATPFAFAENGNDPIQQIQPTGGNTTLADADSSTAPAAGSDMSASDKKPASTKKHVKHHKKHCTKNCKSHHMKKAAKPAPADAAAPSDTMK